MPAAAECTATGTCVITRSMGTGRMSTVTIALRELRRRTTESGTPTVTVSITGLVAPRTLTVAVVASVTLFTADDGPDSSTVAGSARTCATSYPGAGSSSMSGTMGTGLQAGVFQGGQG